jgi:hypothetical protein
VVVVFILGVLYVRLEPEEGQWLQQGVSKKAASFLSQVFLCWDRSGGGRKGETTAAGRTSGERRVHLGERQEDRDHVGTVFPSVKSCGEWD